MLWLLLLPALGGLATAVHILATADMDGWLKGRLVDGYQFGGPAMMLAYWKQHEEFAPGKFLVLSSGDNFSGTPISTLLEGEPDIEVMNAMGYQASALGVHEFDFGRGQLLRLATQATFPLLAANLLNPDGSPSEVAKPYVIIESQGVKVAVIGLMSSTVATHARIGMLKVGPYPAAVRKYAVEARAKGAQVVIVAGSLSQTELVALARTTPDLHIPLMLGGTTSDIVQQYVPDSDTWIMLNGRRWTAYGRVDLEVDAQDGSVYVTGIKQNRLQQRKADADPAIQAIIERWLARLGPDYTKPLGYTASGLPHAGGACAFALQCWLAANQGADFSMVNLYGVRQDLSAGPFTKSDIIEMLPFDDGIYSVKMTGKQLQSLHAVADEPIAVCGLSLIDGKLAWARINQPIDEKTTYHILVNDYLYNNWADLKAADPAPQHICPDWRIPIWSWLAKHETSDKHPLEKEMPLGRILTITDTGIR